MAFDDQTLVPRVPDVPPRMRPFVDKVSGILNALIRRNRILLEGPGDWDLDAMTAEEILALISGRLPLGLEGPPGEPGQPGPPGQRGADGAAGADGGGGAGQMVVANYEELGLWHGKTTTDTPDDEFDAGTLDPKWTVVTGASGTVNRFATSLTNGIYDLASRSGTMLVQVNNGNILSMRQDFTLPDDACIILAMSPSVLADAALVNNELEFALSLNSSNVGPDTGTYQKIEVDVNTDALRFLHFGDGGTTLGTLACTSALPCVYFRVDRKTLTYYASVSMDGRIWYPMGSKTVGSAHTDLWLWFNSSAAFGTPIPISAVHWIRQGTTDLDPWDMDVDGGGPQGEQGNIGPPGSDGPPGEQGEMGPPGVRGETGATGTSILWGNGPPGAIGNTGDAYIDLDTGFFYWLT
jgi:hypothetical protein